MINPFYSAQVDLMLQVIPHVAAEECFALKGGTAINIFVLDMPRLSVDIDLTYLPFNDRETALVEIAESLARIKSRIQNTVPNAVVKLVSQEDGQEVKMICQTPKAQIKIEVNTIMRGNVFSTVVMDVSDKVEEDFGRFVSMKIVHKAELFGGKICAALDRQHPRDLFDIARLFENNGLTADIMNGFILALLSSPRPIHEMLNPNLSDQRQSFDTQFAGMTNSPFTYDDFKKTRERLIAEINTKLTERDRAFLLSFKNAQPDWSLFAYEQIKELPAVKWKLLNIEKLKSKNPEKHQEQLEALEKQLI